MGFTQKLKAVFLAGIIAVSGAVHADPIKVLFLGADSGLSAVKTDILGTDGRFDLLGSSTYAAQSSLPTLAYLLQFNSILEWSNYGPASGLGNLLADYVDGGGHLVMATFNGQQQNLLSGRIMSTGYSPFSGIHDAYGTSTLG